MSGIVITLLLLSVAAVGVAAAGIKSLCTQTQSDDSTDYQFYLGSYDPKM